MTRFSIVSALAAGISLSALLIAAQPGRAEEAAAIVKQPGEITFSGLAGAPQTAVLYGDPTKAALYVSRTKFPAGFKAMPHSHPDAQRTIVILSGTLYFANGDTWDETKLQPYGPGTFFTEPTGQPHFAWAKDGDVIAQISAIGPTGINPVKPK